MNEFLRLQTVERELDREEAAIKDAAASTES
jgi:hypothetical protein